MRTMLCLITLLSGTLLATIDKNSHNPPLSSTQTDGHDHSSHSHSHGDSAAEKVIKWLGKFHPISVHFPIALIVMTAVAEAMALRWTSPLFQDSAYFMIISAAIACIPTVLLGLAYGYGSTYEGAISAVFWWHRFFGLSTAFLCVSTATLKHMSLGNKQKWTRAYRTFLLISLISVGATGYLGGEMTFGLYHLFP